MNYVLDYSNSTFFEKVTAVTFIFNRKKNCLIMFLVRQQTAKGLLNRTSAELWKHPDWMKMKKIMSWANSENQTPHVLTYSSVSLMFGKMGETELFTFKSSKKEAGKN